MAELLLGFANLSHAQVADVSLHKQKACMRATTALRCSPCQCKMHVY